MKERELIAAIARVQAETEICSVKGCSRPVYAVALCSPHYRRLRTIGDVRTDVPLRIARYTKKDKCVECGRGPVYSKMLCKQHYDRSRTGHGK